MMDEAKKGEAKHGSWRAGLLTHFQTLPPLHNVATGCCCVYHQKRRGEPRGGGGSCERKARVCRAKLRLRQAAVCMAHDGVRLMPAFARPPLVFAHRIMLTKGSLLSFLCPATHLPNYLSHNKCLLFRKGMRMACSLFTFHILFRGCKIL
jgi:hypothetical protein